MIYRILILSVLFGMMACSSTKDISKLKEEDVVISLKKGSCYGKCAVYDLNIYKNGFVVYEGKVHSEKIGVYSKNISKTELESFKNDFESIGFFDLASIYPSDIVDLPLIEIMYKSGTKSKTVSGRTERPESLVEIQHKLEKLANSAGWKLEKSSQGDNNKVDSSIPKSMEESSTENQFIIEVKENVVLAAWSKKYKIYNLQIIRKVAPSFDYWVVAFDPKLITSKNMLKLLKADKELKSVEVNRPIGNRDR